MFPTFMNKPAFMANPSNTTFGASTSFGQPTSMFSPMQPTTQSTFATKTPTKRIAVPTKRRFNHPSTGSVSSGLSISPRSDQTTPVVPPLSDISYSSTPDVTPRDPPQLSVYLQHRAPLDQSEVGPSRTPQETTPTRRSISLTTVQTTAQVHTHTKIGRPSSPGTSPSKPSKIPRFRTTPPEAAAALPSTPPRPSRPSAPPPQSLQKLETPRVGSLIPDPNYNPFTGLTQAGPSSGASAAHASTSKSSFASQKLEAYQLSVVAQSQRMGVIAELDDDSEMRSQGIQYPTVPGPIRTLQSLFTTAYQPVAQFSFAPSQNTFASASQQIRFPTPQPSFQGSFGGPQQPKYRPPQPTSILTINRFQQPPPNLNQQQIPMIQQRVQQQMQQQPVQQQMHQQPVQQQMQQQPVQQQMLQQPVQQQMQQQPVQQQSPFSQMNLVQNPFFTPTTGQFGQLFQQQVLGLQPSMNRQLQQNVPMIEEQPQDFQMAPQPPVFRDSRILPGGSNLFGQQPQTASTGLFGTGNAFGQAKPSFGFGSTQPQTGLFGQPSQPQAGTSLFQSNTSNLFGSSSFGNQTTGTVIKFSPVTGADTMQKNGVTQSISTKHHCITCMKEYEAKSLEELRFEDYSVNRKGPQQPSGFGATPFGAPTTGASTSLFGQTDNKQAFGQQSFGQSTFGQTAPSFGVTNQANTNIFGKPNTFGATTSATPTFGFSTPSTSNPFSAAQPQKPFGQQPLFGSTTTPAQQPAFGVFGQPSTNTTTNLFQKPAQPTTGFNAGQTGFSFNQPATTQTSSLFTSKPSTGFSLFGQSTTTQPFGQTTQPAFGASFGKLTQPTFSQPTQPAFGTNLTGGLQQPSLFGSTAAKPPTLFGGGTTTGGLFNNNVFQQTPANFTAVNQQQATHFPPEQSEPKLGNVFNSDSFPDGDTILGLEPGSSGSATDPKELKAVIQRSKQRDSTLERIGKVRVGSKPKRGDNEEFFDAVEQVRSSHKCLVIRKFNENPTNILHKYTSELIDEAEQVLKQQSMKQQIQNEIPECETSLFTPRKSTTDGISPRSNLTDGTMEDVKILPESKEILYQNLRLDLDNTDLESQTNTDTIPQISDRTTDSRSPRGISYAGIEFEIDPIADFTEDGSVVVHNEENPAGVILTRPEYYIYPSLKDLSQYMDENGRCIVKGLTIGRKGYGNVYFMDPIDITNMNLDEIVIFRYRELIIYPDDTKKPPEGEGLNRRAQVTLDKVYPREKDTSNYITDVNNIVKSNFVDGLMRVTVKHDAVFVDYRPKTGSWVFKVKHFSKYGFTESDEEECAISTSTTTTPGQLLLPPQPPPPQPKKKEEIQKAESSLNFGLGGAAQSRSTISINTKESEGAISSVIDWHEEEEEYPMSEDLYHTESSIQPLKSALFTNLETYEEKKDSPPIPQEPLPSEVLVTPKVYKLRSLSSPEKVITTQRCVTDMAVFKLNNFKVGWEPGFGFYTCNPVAEHDVIYGLNHVDIKSFKYNMPNLSDMFKIMLNQTEIQLDENSIPTLNIKNSLTYLEKQSALFDEFVAHSKSMGQEKYLCSVWNLCMALWGPGDDSICGRRQKLSNWLKQYTYELRNRWDFEQSISVDSEIKAFQAIFTLLTHFQIAEACNVADKNKLSRLSLLIGQVSANERFKLWMQNYLDNFVWKENDVIVDDFKKLYLLLAGVPYHGSINTCEGLDWMRSFGVHLWYTAPAATPIHVAFNLYKKAFEEDEYANKPIPPYCNSTSDTKEFDLLYHILSMYVDSTYQLCKVLHPETHTDNIVDYRMSWFLLQLFLSLNVGLIRDADKDYLHTTFSSQLEDLGEWKWAVFVLLFLKNNSLKKNLVIRVLERNLTASETSNVENELVSVFKVPPSWIHEVKAVKAKMLNRHYDYFQHCLYMQDWRQANSEFVDFILPELFINDQYEDLSGFIQNLELYSQKIVEWKTQGGLFKSFLEMYNSLTDIKEDEISSIGSKLSAMFRKINSFPVTNDLQKLCVAEFSKKCALLFTIIHKNLDSENFERQFVTHFCNLAMPPDMKYFEIYHLIARYSLDFSAF